MTGTLQDSILDVTLFMLEINNHQRLMIFARLHSRGSLCFPAPGPGPQFVFTGPGLQFLFTGPGPQFVFTGPGPQFVFTGPGPQFVFTGPGPQFRFTGPEQK